MMVYMSDATPPMSMKARSLAQSPSSGCEARKLSGELVLVLLCSHLTQYAPPPSHVVHHLQSSVKDYIAYFEPLVVSVVKRFPYTSSHLLQQRTLFLLVQLLQLKVPPSLFPYLIADLQPMWPCCRCDMNCWTATTPSWSQC